MLDVSVCNNSDHYNGKLGKSIICAGLELGGMDSCLGDSGGPLTYNGAILVGVVSAGIGCAEAEHPGMYSSVPYFRKWIAKQLLVIKFDLF